MSNNVIDVSSFDQHPYITSIGPDGTRNTGNNLPFCSLLASVVSVINGHRMASKRKTEPVQLKAIPKLPNTPLFASLRTAAKLENLIQRTRLLCDSMHNVFEYIHNDKQSGSLAEIYIAVDQFRSYISNETTLKTTYLRQAQTIARHLNDFYDRFLNQGERALYNPYFKATVKELEKLHKALKA